MSKFEERLSVVEQKLDEVLSLLREKKGQRDYHSKYYAKRREAQMTKTMPGIKNPNWNNLDLHGWKGLGWDKRLQEQMKLWAEICYRFADAKKGSFSFMRWLSYTWNCKTYWFKVITRSGGYNHLFHGFSGTKPLRHKLTDTDLFGCVKRTALTKIQCDQFGEALWWKWGFAVLGKVVRVMQESEDRWAALPKHFTRPMLLLMGSMGEVQMHGHTFNPEDGDHIKVGKMYASAKPDLDRVWNACKLGLFSNEEPFAEFISERCQPC